MKILVLNAGSSSHKSCIFEMTHREGSGEVPVPLWEARAATEGNPSTWALEVRTAAGACAAEEISVGSTCELVARMLQTAVTGPTQVIQSLSEIDCIGHRVVHGGQKHRSSERITPEVKASIRELAVLAPAHNPANWQGIDEMERLLPHVPQYAVFDTAFHSTLPDAAAIYPGPYSWIEQGIRRYGFHGISHQYCARRAAHLLNRDLATLRIISCHLGNGCSLAAIKNGVSVDTTMGFTPLDGLMMGTRSGAVDPGILIYLMRRQGLRSEDLDRILNQESGLKGISDLSGDMREVESAAANGDRRAQLALDIYVHRLRSSIGAMLPALGGLDVLAFTAGVGENSVAIRRVVCEDFDFLGVRLNGECNKNHPVDEDIAAEDSTVRVVVIKTQEDWSIAQECWRLSRLSA